MKSKKTVLGLVVAAMCVLFSACSFNLPKGGSDNSAWSDDESEKKTKAWADSGESETHTPVSIKTSPDKYTWYIKDYVGKNCATLGYTSM